MEEDFDFDDMLAAEEEHGAYAGWDDEMETAALAAGRSGSSAGNAVAANAAAPAGASNELDDETLLAMADEFLATSTTGGADRAPSAAAAAAAAVVAPAPVPRPPPVAPGRLIAEALALPDASAVDPLDPLELAKLTPDEYASRMAASLARSRVAATRASSSTSAPPVSRAASSRGAAAAAAAASEAERAGVLLDRPGQTEHGDVPIVLDGVGLYFLPKRAPEEGPKGARGGSSSSSASEGAPRASKAVREMLEEINLALADKQAATLERARAIANGTMKFDDDDDDEDGKRQQHGAGPRGHARHAKHEDEEEEEAGAGAGASASSAMDEEGGRAGGPPGGQRRGADASASLWATRYAPRQYIDLLSPDGVNKEVLKWLKQWDDSVFGRPKTDVALGQAPAPAAVSGAGSAFFAGGQRGGGGGGGAGGSAGEPSGGAGGGGGYGGGRRFGGGAFGRPAVPSRVLLLCGPPGTGKTTLAHIAASQAGYRSVEVNASDDRTGKSIRDLIVSAQSMRSVFGDQRPACVVLDEIDGMEGGPHGGVAELVKMIKRTNALALARLQKGADGAGGAGAGAGGDNDGSDSDDAGAGAGGKAGGVASSGKKQLAGRKRGRGTTAKGDAGGGGGGGDGDGDDDGPAGGGGGSRGEDTSVLTRPLLCICNDLYASVLRELRPLVHVVEFGTPAPERLKERLQLICKSEGILIAPDAIQALVRLTDADIRSCLNTLQFVKSQAHVTGGRGPGGRPAVSRLRVTADTIERAAVSSKDETKALFDVWGAVFSANLSRPLLAAAKKAASVSDPAGGDVAMGVIWQQAAAYTSDARLLLAGLHENMLQLTVNDPSLMHTCAALDWLCYGEELSHRVASSQNYSLGKYVPAAAAGVHLHRATDMRVRTAWPRADAALRHRRDMRDNILQAFLHARATAPGARPGAGALDRRVAVLDLLSPLLTIVSPAMRVVGNLTLMNSREHGDFRNLVNVSVVVVVVVGRVEGMGGGGTPTPRR
jgi:DNA polymerase III delta prime subunit